MGCCSKFQLPFCLACFARGLCWHVPVRVRTSIGSLGRVGALCVRVGVMYVRAAGSPVGLVSFGRGDAGLVDV
jgi:hypothetical protein